jgi:hypothetical protein
MAAVKPPPWNRAMSFLRKAVERPAAGTTLRGHAGATATSGRSFIRSIGIGVEA